MQNVPTMSRISLASTLDPESITGITSSGGMYFQNAMIEKAPDGTVFSTQRPAINIVADASELSASNKGRGAYYWASQNLFIIVNDDEVWTGLYGTNIGSISAGKEQVWIGEVGNYVVILDHENDEGWTISTTPTLAQISDGDFPSTLAGGGAVLNGSLYVMDNAGTIYGSDIGDPTSWNALNFITAEREPDSGNYLISHMDHVVAIGSTTIEFFYDAANPTGSPLSRREDIFYNIGCLSSQAVYQNINDTYFLSTESSGAIRLYRLRNFQLERLSTYQIEKYLESNIRLNSVSVFMSGANVFGHDFVFITLANISGSAYSPKETLVFDALTSQWSSYHTALLNNVNFPIINWADRHSEGIVYSYGIMSSGDVMRFSGGSLAIDSTYSDSYFVADYIESQDDYVSADVINESATYEFIVRTPGFDASESAPISRHNKFLYKVDLSADYVRTDAIGDSGDIADLVNLRWTDDHYNNYSSVRTISLSSGNQRVTQLGSFKERAFEVSLESQYRCRFYWLDLLYGVSPYA